MNIFLTLLLFMAPLFGEEIDLSLYEKSLYSQNGEDGVLAKLFQIIPTESKFCVEFGAFDGVTGSNTYLLRLQGWETVQFDRQYEISKYNIHKEFITAENINEIFARYKIPENLGLLSIDACPTGAITMKDEGDIRKIWGKRFAMVKCSVCGKPYIPDAQVDWIVKTTGKDRAFFDKCPDHR